MTRREVTRALQEVEDRAKSNTHRIDNLEQEQRAIHDLASSVAVMAKEQGHMREDITEVKTTVSALAAKPGQHWDAVVNKALLVAVGIIIAWLFGRLGIN